MKTYYKVVDCQQDGSLLSTNGKILLKYEVGVTIYPAPNTGGLFVFKDLQSAINFKNSQCRSDYQIYECKATNTRPLYRRSYLFGNCIKDFWSDYFKLRKLHKSTKKITGYNTPAGTYIASSVTLIKEYTND